MISKTGKIIVRVHDLMDKYARREDGSESPILADQRFDNHNKMTITGMVEVGTDSPDVNPVEDANLLMPRCLHYPVGYVGGGVFPVDIRPGDRVWFHYLCAEDRSAMERNRDGSWNVTMQVSDIFCVEREGTLIMNQNWVLAEPVRDQKISLVDAFGFEKAAELLPSEGIQMVEQVKLDPYVDEAYIRHIDHCRYRGVDEEVMAGNRVYLAKDSAFPNVIRNRQRLLCRHTDILAIHHSDPSQVKPVGDNHLVKVAVNEYKSTVIHHTVIVKAPEWGLIVNSGKRCKQGNVGSKIMFTRRWCRPLTKEYWLVSDHELLALLQ